MAHKPHYTLINTSKGKDPAVVVVNSALRTFNDRQAFPWHLKINIDCKLLSANGMPTSEESEALKQLEDEIARHLQAGQNAIFLARATCRGERTLLYRVHDPERANEILLQLVSAPAQLREWDYRIERDPDWELAQPELNLLEHDLRIN